MADFVFISDLDKLAAAPWTDPEINTVSLFMIDGTFRLPVMSAQVTSLELMEVILRGPVTLPSGLQWLKLTRLTSEVPLSEWDFPSSLKKICMSLGPDDICDLSRTQAESIEIRGSYNFQTVRLPETLHLLSLNLGDSERLPVLPQSLRRLNIQYCSSLMDCSGAEMITELDIDDVIPFEQYFPNLEKLTVHEIIRVELTMSMPKLKTLSISAMSFSGGLGLDMPNLVSLKLEKFKLVGGISSRGSHGDGPEVNSVLLPKFPLLESLELIGQLAQTNGVQVRNYSEYVAAWGGKSGKSARSAAAATYPSTPIVETLA